MKSLLAIICAALSLSAALPAKAAVFISTIKGHNVASISGCAGDGLIGAPFGTPQHPTLLASLAFRPPCAVALVDYRVGPPTNLPVKLITDAGVLPAGFTYDAPSHQVRCDGTDGLVLGSSAYVVDMWTDGGSFNITGGCNNLTIKNLRIREFTAATAAGCGWAINQDKTNHGVTLINVEVDGNGVQGGINCGFTNSGGEAVTLTGWGPKVLDYVWIHDVTQHNISLAGPGTAKAVTLSISGTVATVTACCNVNGDYPANPPLAIGDTLQSVPVDATRITADASSGPTACAGSPCTGTGGTGTYAVNNSQTFASTLIGVIGVGPYSTATITHSAVEGCGFVQGGHCNGIEFTGAQFDPVGVSMVGKWNTVYNPQPSSPWSTTDANCPDVNTPANVCSASFTSGSNDITLVIQNTNQNSFRRLLHITGTRFAGTGVICTIDPDTGSYPITSHVHIYTDATCVTPLNASSSGTGNVTVTDMWPIGETIPIRYTNDGGASRLGAAEFSHYTFIGFGPIKGNSYNIGCDGATLPVVFSDLYFQAADTASIFNLSVCPGSGNGATEMSTGAHTARP